MIQQTSGMMANDSEKYSGKKILIGITGGIAAYKIAELIRYFVKSGAEVRVVMTKNATEFITPLTIETLSNNRVTTDTFPGHDAHYPEMWGTHHVNIAQWPDIMLIAPAGGNVIGKIASGIADDALTTIVMACSKPVALAVAMNDRMYTNSIVQQNIKKLRDHGYHIIDPGNGFLAEGYEGVGRLAEFESLIWEADKILLGTNELKNKRVLITAGPTQEPLDPVRILTNHSSGKMGYAIAREAALMGAEVTLISGPTALPVPPGVSVMQVTTADAMDKAVRGQFTKHDALIMTAAVADFKPVRQEKQKIKKTGAKNITLELTRTPDILANIGKQKGRRYVVGFALETDQEIENAQRKLHSKNLDFIVANNPKEQGAGFNTDTNIVTIIDKNSILRWPKMSKAQVARKILEKVSKEI